jgi:hypothetical protein
MIRLPRLLLAAALAAAIVVFAAAPAWAKGFSLERVDITGPGLEEPLRITGRPLWARRGFTSMAALLTDGLFGHQESTRPTWLGPRYTLNLHLTL